METIGDDCVREILSRTSPGDILRFAVSSKQFQAIAHEQMVWEIMWNNFSLNTIVSKENSIDKRNLLLMLGKSHIIIDDSLMLFLDNRSGKMSFVVGAKGFFIEFVDDQSKWRWIPDECSRFSEVGWVYKDCPLNIKFKIKTRVLSKDTHYGIYLKYKPRDCNPNKNRFLAYGVVKHASSSSQINILFLYGIYENGARRPVYRDDGWMEIEIGDFHNNKFGDDDDNCEALASVRNMCSVGYCGLVFECIEVRPKI